MNTGAVLHKVQGKDDDVSSSLCSELESPEVLLSKIYLSLKGSQQQEQPTAQELGIHTRDSSSSIRLK